MGLGAAHFSRPPWPLVAAHRTGRLSDGPSTRFFRFPSPFPPQPFLRNGTLITDFSDNPPELQAWAAFRLFADSRGFVWAGTMQRVGGHDTPNELVRWDPSTDRFSPFPNDDEDFVPMSFAEDQSGAVWIGGYNGGLRRVAPGGVRLEDRSMLVPAGPVQALLVDGRGRLWIGTAEHGLVRVDSPADRPVVGARYGPAQGLSSADVRALVEDTSGRLYVGHAHGIDVVSGDDAIERSYTSADGLAPGAVWCAFRDATGALWFGTPSGLSRLVPVPGGTAVPTMAITGVSVGGQSLGISEVGEQSLAPFEVPPESPAIRIAYAALGGGPPSAVRYQVRLEGAETDWSAPLSQQSAEFTRLAPGSYRFVVRAVSPSGSVLSDVGVVPFTVLRPIWARWWSVALLSLAAVALLYALHQTRVARAIAVERVRLRLARDLHDELGSNLSRLAILGDVAQRDPARVPSVLAEVSATARRLMDALSDVVWFVDPRHDDLASVIDLAATHGRDLFEPLGVAWTCRVPDDAAHVKLLADTRRELYLILKEAVTNAARHAGCAHASLDVRLEAGTVIATVSDDGRGFDTADATSNGSRGNGLRNMRSRAAAIGATLDVTASPAGTAVRVTLRVR
jgi:signal transduction histidine kinase